ncbi:MAG TPA: SPOR domain-containing protein, partial [Pricia sp.]|nr:SPOR domain-containing protein [Pricia sp.]
SAIASNDIKLEIIKRMAGTSDKNVNAEFTAEPVEMNLVALKSSEAIADNMDSQEVAIESVEKKAPVLKKGEAIADNTAQQDVAADEAYIRTVKFEPVDKVLGEIIAKPAVTQNTNADAMKDGVKLPIRTMKKSDLVGVKSGYYVIANVFKSRKYLDAFLGDLKQKGLDAGYFFNKENGLHYVYLADYNYKSDAKTAYVTNLNGQYNEEKWIMQVDNMSAIVDNYYEDQ